MYYTVNSEEGKANMATTKASAKKPATSRASAVKKSTVTKTVAKKTERTTAAKTASVASPAKFGAKAPLFPANLPNIILVELLGTFILTIVALSAFAVSPYTASKAGVLSSWLVDPLFIGLTVMVLTMGFGAVSGAHVNPAVTFGFWSMRKLKSIMLPVYWLSQFLGALLAVGVVNVMTSGQFVVSLTNFLQFNMPLFFIELIGTAVFMFGYASVMSREGLSLGAKALGIGTALTIALVAGASMLATVQKADVQSYQTEVQKASSQTDANNVKIPRTLLVNSPVLNPAVAIAVQENGSDQATTTSSGTTTTAGAKLSSRFGLEVILGSLVGAALGANLYLLVAYRSKNEA